VHCGVVYFTLGFDHLLTLVATQDFAHRFVRAALRRVREFNLQVMRARREAVEHPFAKLKISMGATHFLCKTLPKVATELALNVLGYSLTRVMNIAGVTALVAATRA
jgi:hypothetical protein